MNKSHAVLFFSIILGALILGGFWYMNKYVWVVTPNNKYDFSRFDAYYQNLANNCDQSFNQECCLDAVLYIANNNFQELSAGQACPNGSFLNSYKCGGPSWCDIAR